MKESRNFIFDGISSEDMGVSLISSTGKGLLDESFLPSREIVETRIPGREKSFLQRVVEEPLSFTILIFIEEWAKRDNLRQIARWLYQPYYKPLIMDSNLDRVYYAMLEGDSTLYHNGLKEGYVELSVRCDSPHSYSPLQTSQEYVVDGEKEVFIYNMGDTLVRPKAWIKKIGNGDVKIKNHSNSQVVIIEELKNKEELFIDFENEEIVSSLEELAVYRYDNHNNVWLELTDSGHMGNKLVLTGNYTIYFEYKFKYITDWR